MVTTKQIRKDIINMAYRAKSAHIGSALSLVEILHTLYFKVANFSAENYRSPDRDKIILSKGHGSAALYSVLHHKGLIPAEDLEYYSVNGGRLPCHIDMATAKGLEASTGSLAHGLGIGVGMAMSDRMNEINARVYVIIGDGEAQEGSIWEAVELAATLKLNNLTVIVDFNEFQASGGNVIEQQNLAERFAAFGFEAYDINGHDENELERVLKISAEKPKAVIARTLKGKGVSFMENTLKSHYTKLDDDLYQRAIQDIEGAE